MVKLLDLPNEILEMILARCVRSIDPLMSSQPSCYSMGISALRVALPLRLVHRRFRDLADPHIFRNIACLLTDLPHVRDSNSGQERGIIELLAANENIGGSVKNIRFEGYHNAAGDRSRLQNRALKVMRHAHATVEGLSFEVHERGSNVVADPIPLYTGIFSTGLPRLTSLMLGDASFITCLPEILASAPLLSDVALWGTSSWDSQCGINVTFSPDDVPLPAFVVGTVKKPIPTLKLGDFGFAWFSAFMTHLKPYADEVAITTEIQPWEGYPEQHFHALVHFADSPSFNHLCITQDDLESNTEDDEEVGYRQALIHDYMQVAARQRAEVVDQLAKVWCGKGVAISREVPRQDWEELLVQADYPSLEPLLKQEISTT